MGVTLSLAMIVKNEAKTIARVLKDAQGFCDELVVVDTGSTDDTVAIAQSMGAKVFHFEWIDHFAAARNCAFSHCTGDWIIWLDADDIVAPADQEKINALKRDVLPDTDAAAVFCTYQTGFSPKGECIFSFPRERLLRRSAGFEWKGAIHECIDTSGYATLSYENINIQHRPLPEKHTGPSTRNLRILEKCLAEGDRSPRNLFYYANELRDHSRFEEAIPVYQEYLNISNLAWEKYSAILSVIRCLLMLDREEEIVPWCYAAIDTEPSRAEAFNQLGIYYYRKEEWLKAIPFLAAADSLPKPTVGFVSDADYTYVPSDYLCICYDRLGWADKALEMCLRTYAKNPDQTRITRNMFYLGEQFLKQFRPQGAPTDTEAEAETSES